jgi:hypothetical protein
MPLQNDLLTQSTVQSIQHTPPDPRIHLYRTAGNHFDPSGAPFGQAAPLHPTSSCATLQPHTYLTPRLRWSRTPAVPAVSTHHPGLHRAFPRARHLPRHHQLDRAAPRLRIR